MNETISERQTKSDLAVCRVEAEEKFLNAIISNLASIPSTEGISHSATIVRFKNTEALLKDCHETVPVIRLKDSIDNELYVADSASLLMKTFYDEAIVRSDSWTIQKDNKGIFYSVFRRALRSVCQLMKSKEKKSEKIPKFPIGDTRMLRDVFPRPVGVPVTQVSPHAFSKFPSRSEIMDEFERMRNPFPNVPKYKGNPPWLTRYHPDLVKLPKYS